MDNLYNFSFGIPLVLLGNIDSSETPFSEIPTEYSSEFSPEGLPSSEEISSEEISSEYSSEQSYQEMQEENVNLGKIEQNTRALTGLFMVFLVGVGLFLVAKFFFGLFNK